MEVCLFLTLNQRKGYAFMEEMQNDNIGYLAVSLGFTRPYSLHPVQALHLKYLKKNKFKWDYQKVWFVFQLGLIMTLTEPSRK